MRGYPDGMQRLPRIAAVAATAVTLAVPASADAPQAWDRGNDATGSFSVLRAVSPDVALAGAFDGGLLRTTDGGETWVATTAPSVAGLRDVASTDGQTIYTVDTRGTAMRSQDAGGTWSKLTVPGRAHPL